jgi:hypothetical protein
MSIPFEKTCTRRLGAGAALNIPSFLRRSITGKRADSCIQMSTIIVIVAKIADTHLRGLPLPKECLP